MASSSNGRFLHFTQYLFFLPAVIQLLNVLYKLAHSAALPKWTRVTSRLSKSYLAPDSLI